MAEKELRKMSRPELIEIIYALQQNERTLRAENEELQRRLDDKIVRTENAGNLAEAVLSINHMFESAQETARQYILSAQDAQQQARQTLAEAEAQAQTIVADARQTAQTILVAARDEQAAANRLHKRARQEHAAGMEQLANHRKQFVDSCNQILRQNPELAARLRLNHEESHES